MLGCKKIGVTFDSPWLYIFHNQLISASPADAPSEIQPVLTTSHLLPQRKRLPEWSLSYDNMQTMLALDSQDSCLWSAVHVSHHALHYLARPPLQAHVSTKPLLASSIPAPVAFLVSLQRPNLLMTLAITVDSTTECSSPGTLHGSLLHFTCVFTQLLPPQRRLP